MKYAFYPVCGALMMMLLSCNHSSPTEQMTFRNKEYTDQVIAKLKEQQIPFKQPNEITVQFSVNDSSAVLKAVSEIDASLPLMYAVYGEERKIAFEKALTANGVAYKAYVDESGGYAFLIDNNYRSAASKAFEQIK